jgi:phosphomannomutase
MKINPEIFRMYDVRGKYPNDLGPKTAYQIGRFFIQFLRQKTKKKKFKIAAGRDVRPSSPILFKYFSKGIIDEGCNVIDLGLITTPMLYFAIFRFNYDGGAIITASHNPNPWNGIKLMRERVIPLSGERGIFWIRDKIIRNKKSFKKRQGGKIIKKNIEKEYLDFNLKLAGIKKGELKGGSLAVDAGNGIAGPTTIKILKETKIKIYPLYCKPDGSFPHHVPDPLLKENLKDIILLIKQEKPLLGIALDGDGDRIIFIDERGKPVSGDLVTALVAKIILKENPKAKILYDVRSSNIVGETIKANGGKPIKYKIGHALIKEKIRRDNILFAGELAGHYYLGKKMFYEVPLFVLLRILKELKEKKTVFSQLIKPFQRYYHSGEINFKVKDKEGKIKELKNRYRSGKTLEIDGLRVDFNDWWFLVRPSNTEPILRLVLEAKNFNLLEKKKKELTEIISKPL